MSYIYHVREEDPLFHAAAVQIAESLQWTTKPRLLGAILFFTDCWRHVRKRWRKVFRIGTV